MNTRLYHRSRWTNFLHTSLLLIAMTGLLAFLGWILFGSTGLLMVGGSGLVLLLMSPNLSSQWIMRWARARPLHPYEVPGLYQINAQLAQEAELEQAPQLYLLPSPELNAFAVGKSGNYAIALSSGLLRNLNQRELVGVLAHEMSHIANGDLRVMALAGTMMRMTRTLSNIGLILLLLFLPVALFEGQFPLLLPLILLAAPVFSGLLQLALSRTREFAADAKAAAMTGDPRGLASALNTLERQTSGGMWQRLFGQVRPQEPSWLRTHPATRERIERLLAFELPHRPVRLQRLDQRALAGPYRIGPSPMPRELFWMS